MTTPIFDIIILVIHILASCVAAGTVAVTDYFHLIGLKNHKLEKKIILVYPYLSRLINIALAIIIITGVLLVINNNDLLDNSLFRLKMLLVFIVTINGIVLQKLIAPHMENMIKHDKAFPTKWLYITSAAGAISVVSWFGILILAFTKEVGYTWIQFAFIYLGAIIFVFIVAQFMERKAHQI